VPVAVVVLELASLVQLVQPVQLVPEQRQLVVEQLPVVPQPAAMQEQ